MLWALAAAAQAGCAPALAPQAVEAAYVEARTAKAACRPGDVACCAGQVTVARGAGERGESDRAAHLWQELALVCPVRRAEAAAAVQVREPGQPGDVLNVSYRVHLPPAVRLFWVGTSAGGRLLPRAGLSTGSVALEVEVQAIRFAGSRPGPLLVVQRRFELDLPRQAAVTIEITEAPRSSAVPLELRAQVTAPPPAAVPRSTGAPAPPRPAPRLESARLLYLPAARAPLELAGAAEPGAWLCLDRDGQLDTIRFLEPAHPRLAASLVDRLRDARHEPYRVNDRAVPSCRTFSGAATP
jgi:hypothetical protein